MARCNRKADVYSRVVGYYVRVEDANLGKREEFQHRRMHTHADGERITPDPDTARIEEERANSQLFNHERRY